MIVGKCNYFNIFIKFFIFAFRYTGESGLGKATLINNLFQTDLYSERYTSTAQGK